MGFMGGEISTVTTKAKDRRPPIVVHIPEESPEVRRLFGTNGFISNVLIWLLQSTTSVKSVFYMMVYSVFYMMVRVLTLTQSYLS